MRRVLSLMMLCACGGTWSEEDLPYFDALPRRAELRVTAPPGTHRAAAAAGDFNFLINTFFAMSEQARDIAPTSREGETRIWGPYTDAEVATREIRLRVQRADGDRFDWNVEARPPSGAWVDIVDASSLPLERRGTLSAPVAAFRNTVAVADDLKTLEAVRIDWSAAGADLLLTGTSRFASAYAHARSDAGTTLVFGDVTATWTSAGGRSEGAGVIECWNADGALVACP